MLRQIWALTRKEIKLSAEHRGEWLLVFLTPIIFIAVMGATFGNTGVPTVAVYLVNADEGRLGRQIASALRDEPTLAVEFLDSRAEADRRVGEGQRMAAIVIPAGLSEAVLTDAGGQIEIIVDPAREQTAGIVIGQVQAATAPMLIDAEVERAVKTVFNTAPDTFGFTEGDLEELGIDLAAVANFLAAAIKGVVSSQVQDAIDDPLVRIDMRPASDAAPRQAPTIFDYLVPGYSVFFAFFLMGLMAETVYEERISGALRRIFSLPIRRVPFLVGKTLPYSLIAMLQIVIVFSASALLFDYDLGEAPMALALLIVATGLSVGGLGILVSVLVRSEGQANSIPTLLTLVMAAVSGALFPSIQVPGLSQLTPHYWAVQGFLTITALRGDLADILPNLGALLVFAVVSFGIAVWRFRHA
ncbi:MAG: ABC transporter permease [Caldilinea sp.]